MESTKGPSRSARLLGVFEVTGDILTLQLLFLLASLPVITMFPAALALQYSLGDIFVEGRPRPARLFWANFTWALRRTWKVAVLLPLIMVLAAASLLFWLTAGGLAGVVALCILVPMYGVLVAGYVAVLASTLQASAADTGTLGSGSIAGFRERLSAAWSLAQRRAIPLALSVVVMVTWLLVLAKLPTLVLVGTGLVPAGLAWWVAAPWIQDRRATLAAGQDRKTG
ncbi:DUF624 domain-containing protein [Pseudarthrobacter sp. SSS035]|uniref:DUF624 domain-containing protein n=1 Tax=Pseudarthrobacter sp. SSS035 TaxID=2931399 RepID=UPI00200EFA58|nr:DUF624 domain-containing protein [Pseudarthrobacter sp. SSS035]